MNFTDWLILNQHTGEIARAIESLRPTTDYVKDYIFPVAMAFASALMGGVVAMRLYRKQELQKATKENFTTANEVFIMAHDCLNSLVGTKVNYVNAICSDEPMYRVFAFPEMIAKYEEAKFKANSLYFIRAFPTANKTFMQSLKWKLKHQVLRKAVENPSPEELASSWRNTVRISSMFGNYNLILEYVRKRSQLNVEQLKVEANQYLAKSPTFDELFTRFSAREIGGLIDVTESTISLIDHVIVELYRFLLEFPEIAESNIELNRIKEWGRLPRYRNEKPLFLKCLTPIVKPNYEKLGKYVGISTEEAKSRYTYNEWV
ncbi:TPA: hypothetical protein ACSRPO_001558 [Enterobacter asburiae]